MPRPSPYWFDLTLSGLSPMPVVPLPASASGLQVVRIPLHELHQDPQNPKLHTERNYRAIAASLRDHGQVAPLVVQDSSRIIIAGNATALSMAALGMTHADVVLLDVDDRERRRLAVRLNRTSELGGWDTDVLKDALEGWGSEYDDLWDATEAAAIFADPGGDGDDDEDPIEVPAEPVSVLGEVYELGPHRLVCGDSTDAGVWPRYCDVIRRRWTRWAVKNGVEPGPGALSGDVTWPELPL